MKEPSPQKVKKNFLALVDTLANVKTVRLWLAVGEDSQGIESARPAARRGVARVAGRRIFGSLLILPSTPIRPTLAAGLARLAGKVG